MTLKFDLILNMLTVSVIRPGIGANKKYTNYPFNLVRF